MDKVEYKIKADEIKALISQGAYQEAVEIADEIDWRRVKSVMMLCTISDLYKINRRYDDARNILNMAYEKHPGSRTIVYSLCELCIKTGDLVMALEYCKEYAQLAPRDIGKHILTYKMYRAQGVSLEEQIAILEELKSQEYREKWAYELAYLYHRVGLATKCIEECDELFLWFGSGKYVIKALELKMLHTGLTPQQQEVYDHRFDEEIAEAERLEAERAADEEAARAEQEAQQPSEETGIMFDVLNAPTARLPVEEIEIQVKTIENAPFDTINLQQEVADGIKAYLEKEERRSQELPKELERSLSMDSDGQMSLVVPEESKVEKQITGQLSIDDILGEWERMKKEREEKSRADIRQKVLEHTGQMFTEFEAAVKDGYLEKLEKGEIQGEAVITEEDVVEELPEFGGDFYGDDDFITGRIDVSSAMEPEEVTEEVPEEAAEPEAVYEEAAEEVVEEVVEEVPEEASEPEAVYEEAAEEVVEEVIEEVPEEAAEPEAVYEEAAEEVIEEVPEEASEPEAVYEEAAEEVVEEVPEEAAEPEAVYEEAAEEVVEEVIEEVPEEASEPEAVYEEEAAEPEEPEEVPAEAVIGPEEVPGEAVVPGDEVPGEAVVGAEEPLVGGEPIVAEKQTENVPASEGPEDSMEEISTEEGPVIEEESFIADHDDTEEAEEPLSPKEQEQLRELSPEEEALFTGYADHPRSKRMLIKALDTISLASYTGNVVITGEDVNNCLRLSKCMIKDIQASDSNFSGKVAKISGNAMNHRDISATFEGLAGGALIIQKASDIENETAGVMYKALQQEKYGILIFLEDSKKAMARFLDENPDLATCFNARMEIRALSDKDLVRFGQEYARTQEYVIDEMGILALHTRIAELQTSDHCVTKSEVQKMVDEAIRHVSKVTVGHFFDIVTGKRYDAEDMIILREKDFAEN